MSTLDPLNDGSCPEWGAYSACAHPDCLFARAVDTLEFTNDLPAEQFYADTTREQVKNACAVIDAWETLMVESSPPESECCAHCERPADDSGDVVAACTWCDVRTCARCWERLHAETCGDT